MPSLIKQFYESKTATISMAYVLKENLFSGFIIVKN